MPYNIKIMLLLLHHKLMKMKSTI